MKLRLLVFSLFSTLLLGAGEILFMDDFGGAELSSDWSVSGGSFTVKDNTLFMKSENSNPIARVDAGTWKNYQLTFNLVRKGYSHFEVYAGMRYPQYAKFTLRAPHEGSLTLTAGRPSGPEELLQSVDYTGRIDAAEPMAFRITVAGNTLHCSVNGVDLIHMEDTQAIGGIAFGGGWNSDFEISAVKVEQMTDLFSRPEIRNGTFYDQGKPTFMLGVNDSSNFWEFTSANARPPFEPNDLYTDLLSVETARKLGFNCDHVYTYARQVSDNSLYELGLTSDQADQLLGFQYRDHWTERERHRSRIAGLPLVVDYSLLHLFTMDNLAGRIAAAGQPPELRHDGGFMPYVPEMKLGRDIYNLYFRDGARWWLNNGNSNPWVYELFNEVQWYHSKHPRNKELFAEWLRTKYDDDLERLRAVWAGETPPSFEAAAELTPWSGGAMKADWMDFLGDRFVEIFNEGKAHIRSIDPRPNVYFDIEIAVSSLWYEQNGIDYHKLMKSADLFGTEGGMPFGVHTRNESDDYLEAVMNPKRIEVMFYSDLARTFAGDKPIMNQESYVRRSHAELGVVPTRRSDFPTLFWFEVFHNYSGSQVYCWWKGGQSWPWETLEDARDTARQLPPALLNPYMYPLDSLSGFQDFREEIDRLAEVALPYPRTVNEIGVLYSLPSVWRQPHAVSHLQKFDYQQKCFNWYDAFCRAQLPVGVISEQEVLERGPGSFQVIAVPYPTHSYPGVAEALQSFMANGGLVLFGEGSLRYDPYGREQHDVSINGRNVKIIPAGIPEVEQQERLLEGLYELGYRAPWRIESEDDLSQLEIRGIHRDAIHLYFLCNWDGRQTSFARFVPAVPEGELHFVTDLVEERPILSPSGNQSWTRTELATGIPVAIPSQQRVLIGVSRESYAKPGAEPWTEAGLAAKAQADAVELEEILAPLDRELEEKVSGQAEQFRKAREPFISASPADGRFQPLDLSAAVNMGFRDEVAGDRQGGWTDQGSMDFREFPLGLQSFAGIPFHVIDPSHNQNKSCIVLAGSVPYFPEASLPVAVDRNVKNLYFLHAAAWGGQSGKQFEYRIVYEDGAMETFEIRGGLECSDWVGNQPIANGRIVAEMTKPDGMKIGAYVTRWENPRPESKVVSIQAVSARAEAVPVIIAMTAETVPE